jgi:hypothetical protein
MKRYTATEQVLALLGRRLLCKMNGHDPVHDNLMQANAEGTYRCDNCDAKFEITYPALDYEVSEE